MNVVEAESGWRSTQNLRWSGAVKRGGKRWSIRQKCSHTRWEKGGPARQQVGAGPVRQWVIATLRGIGGCCDVVLSNVLRGCRPPMIPHKSGLFFVGSCLLVRVHPCMSTAAAKPSVRTRTPSLKCGATCGWAPARPPRRRLTHKQRWISVCGRRIYSKERIR